MEKLHTLKSICPLDCPDTCGIVASIENGKIVSLSGDKDHPYTNGFICRKMRGYLDRFYSPERILFPQLRVGRKGEGKFKRISWQEALQLCAERLLEVKKEYGGEAILPYSYAGNMGAVNRLAGYPLFHKLGTSQLEQTICSAASGAGWKKQCGPLAGCPPENAADARLIIAWGINIKVSNVHFWPYVRQARKKGARLVVIDPYRNETAQAADEYVQVNIGGDTALALGILQVLLESDGVDNQFIQEQTTGFADLKAYVCGRELAEFARISGVSETVIRMLAREIVKTPKTFIRIGVGISRNSRGAMSIRAISSLAAALGLFAGGTGRGVLLSAGAFKGETEILTGESLRTESTRSINMIHLGYALTGMEQPVKALVVYNSNPASVNPDSSSVRFGLARDDLFTVVHEQVMTPTARFADLLLPATTFLENLDVYTGYGHFYMGVAKPVVEPAGEAKSNFDFFQALALACGFNDATFHETCRERLKRYLATMGGVPQDIGVEEIIEGRLVHSTKSCASGEVLKSSGLKFHFSSPGYAPEPPIACLTDAGEFVDPDLLARFPLQLITPPHPDLLNSTFGEKYQGECGSVLIHPDDAARFNVKDGAMVIIANNRGRSTRKATVSQNTKKGVLVAEGLFWIPVEDSSGVAAGGINDLTSQKLADMGGGATFHECMVTLIAR
ncbi:molybdopterin-dependent oxidoreductase [Desulforhopalus sp. IMCC35007]|uniref:molybdopterin-containing oxidoreductase family protein n=1 Tax=Desulforhopalus sp. IMCC35007 TaxID=2569543 RepID=UPI00145C4A88|nr:molybdopterin-dependent oxidoreductase [Desulforhopalus sp. IMCC35007]